jgi:hypothetical protein
MGLGNITQPLTAEAAQTGEYNFQIEFYPPPKQEICVGDSQKIIASVWSPISGFGYAKFHVHTPISVMGASRGTITPPTRSTGFYGEWAWFTYTARSAGTETLRFTAEITDRRTEAKEHVDRTFTFEVRNCPKKVSILYQGTYAGEGFALATTGWMDEVTLDADEDSSYSGAGTLPLVSTLLGVPGCVAYGLDMNEVHMTATLGEQNLTVVFDAPPGHVVAEASCYGYGGTGGGETASLNEVGLTQITVPQAGGVVRLAGVGIPGAFTIIVTREAEEEAVSDAGGPQDWLSAWLYQTGQ